MAIYASSGYKFLDTDFGAVQAGLIPNLAISLKPLIFKGKDTANYWKLYY